MRATCRANLPEVNTGIGAGLVGSTVSTTSPYCHVAYGMLTQLRGLGSYVIPKIDAQVSAVFQSKPGALLVGQLRDARGTGRDVPRPAPSGNVPNVTINLIEPGSLYGDRINQLDFRIAKNFTFGVDTVDGLRRPLQRDEREPGAHLQQQLHAERTVAAAELDSDRTPDSHQRRFQFLTREAHEEHEVHEGRRRVFRPASSRPAVGRPINGHG